MLYNCGMKKEMFNQSLYELEHADIFSKVTAKLRAYKAEHPEAEVISLSIGDVSRPIVRPIIEAMHQAVDDLASYESFRGYGGYYGFDFLREAVLEHEYLKYGFSKEEIYISNGTKTDTTSILEMFDHNCRILIGNPMYPIYRDGAKAMGRKVFETGCDEEYKMLIPQERYDIIYLCSPSNPVGNAYNREELSRWIEYAKHNGSVILLDNVYKAFVQSEDVPESIYELEGSKQTCIEFRSFSKQASFTSMRCSYYVIPKELHADINLYWDKRTMNRFNGADYVAQKGALASYLPQAQKEIKENIAYYQENALIIRQSLEEMDFKVQGGIDAPYMWVKTRDGMTGWQMFDFLLNELQIAVVPGEIFGTNGIHHIRLSALGRREDQKKALERLKKYYEEKA